MALSGVHVACVYVGGKGADRLPQALIRRIVWSQTMASATTTTNAAPGVTDGEGTPSFEIRSSADVFVAVSAAPDATNGPRIFVPASETRNVFCAEGDKLAWIAA